jgi:hypothetical protein
MDIKVIKLKIRRGTNAQRKQVVLDEGELGYTIDTQRLYIGTGFVSGGMPASSRFYQPLSTYNSLTGLGAEVGDIASANNIIYQAIGENTNLISSWKNISPALDNYFFFYKPENNEITLKVNSISATYLDNYSLSSSTIYLDNTNNNRLTVVPQGINYSHISPAALSGGLQGGGTSPIRLNFDTAAFYIDNNNKLNTNMQTIYDTITGSDDANFLFNGDPSNAFKPLGPGIGQTVFKGLSAGSGGEQIPLNLYSAGFIAFLGNTPTTSSNTRKPARYAIPVFAW